VCVACSICHIFDRVLYRCGFLTDLSGIIVLSFAQVLPAPWVLDIIPVCVLTDLRSFGVHSFECVWSFPYATFCAGML